MDNRVQLMSRRHSGNWIPHLWPHSPIPNPRSYPAVLFIFKSSVVSFRPIDQFRNGSFYNLLLFVEFFFLLMICHRFAVEFTFARNPSHVQKPMLPEWSGIVTYFLPWPPSRTTLIFNHDFWGPSTSPKGQTYRDVVQQPPEASDSAHEKALNGREERTCSIAGCLNNQTCLWYL